MVNTDIQTYYQPIDLSFAERKRAKLGECSIAESWFKTLLIICSCKWLDERNPGRAKRRAALDAHHDAVLAWAQFQAYDREEQRAQLAQPAPAGQGEYRMT